MPTTPNVADSSPLRKSALMKSACQHRIAAKSDDVPGGFTSDGTDDSLMGFMTSSEKYLTFGAKAPLELSWASSVSDSKAFSSNLDYSASKESSKSTTVSGSVTFATGGITKDSDEGTGHSISIGKTSDSSHSFERSVSIVLDDVDYGDYFAVRITEDPVYGTPVFTTMGGQSKCPGESGTNRRESQVSIQGIVPRCGT
eukprot:gene63886-87375_t